MVMMMALVVKRRMDGRGSLYLLSQFYGWLCAKKLMSLLHLILTVAL
jgi:hypothetical protein